MNPLRIGITYTEKIANFLQWLADSPFPTEPIVLNHHSQTPNNKLLTQNLLSLNSLNAIIFSGGDDFSPNLLGLPNTSAIIDQYHLIIDEERDIMEWKLAEEAMKLNLPTLGICRGMQLINLVMGGSVFLDILEENATMQSHSAISPQISSYHQLIINKDSNLSRILNAEQGTVNSRHHQAVKEVPTEHLTPVAYSDDGIIEAIENPTRNIILVQWHPEIAWKDGAISPFSKELRDAFLKSATDHRKP